jgi:hypothetical protein
LRCLLTQWRVRAGINTRQLHALLAARKTPIALCRVSGIQNGDLLPTDQELLAICRALECHPSDLYDTTAREAAAMSLERVERALQPAWVGA